MQIEHYVFQIFYSIINGFFRATRHNKIEIVKYLLKQNVDADAKNINNQTALHNACFKGAHEIVKLLLDHGVIYDSKNLDGDKPAHLAVKGKHTLNYFFLSCSLFVSRNCQI